MARDNPHVPSVDDVIFAIRAFVKTKGWSLNRLATEAGMHDTTLRHFWLPTWSPKSDTLRILHALVPAGFDPHNPGPAEPPGRPGRRIIRDAAPPQSPGRPGPAE